LIKNGISYKEIDFFVKTLHICSSDIASNPIFCQVGRKYISSFEYNDNNKVFYYLYDKYQNKLSLDKELTLIKWNEYNDENENLLLSTVCT